MSLADGRQPAPSLRRTPAGRSPAYLVPHVRRALAMRGTIVDYRPLVVTSTHNASSGRLEPVNGSATRVLDPGVLRSLRTSNV